MLNWFGTWKLTKRREDSSEIEAELDRCAVVVLELSAHDALALLGAIQRDAATAAESAGLRNFEALQSLGISIERRLGQNWKGERNPALTHHMAAGWGRCAVCGERGAHDPCVAELRQEVRKDEK